MLKLILDFGRSFPIGIKLEKEPLKIKIKKLLNKIIV